jgi:hypothetical protein
MKITTQTIFFAHKRQDYPFIYGEWKNHILPSDPVIGHLVDFGVFRANLDIAYLPLNHKRDRLMLILCPDRAIPDTFWAGDFVKHDNKEEIQKEEVSYDDVF